MLQANSISRSSNGDRLLDNVTLQIAAGDRAAIVGPSGSGKTLLLRALAMLDRLDGGSVSWQGQPISGSDVPRFRSQVMYLPQRPVLLETTVAESLRRAFELNVHRHKTFRPAQAVSVLEQWGRGRSFLEKHQRDLSGGELQIAALLRAVLLDPEYLLMDEPTAALDRTATLEIETWIDAWLKESPSRAMVWVTHEAVQARRIATSWWTMNEGSIQATMLDGGA